jgi:hypothetical protein
MHQSKSIAMVAYSLLVLVVFLSSASSRCVDFIVCVTNDAERVCNRPSNATVTAVAGVHRWLRNQPQCLTLQFTSGLHILEDHLVAESGLSLAIIKIVGKSTLQQEFNAILMLCRFKIMLCFFIISLLKSAPHNLEQYMSTQFTF